MKYEFLYKVQCNISAETFYRMQLDLLWNFFKDGHSFRNEPLLF